jgi:anti-anti-sigma factor
MVSRLHSCVPSPAAVAPARGPRIEVEVVEVPGGVVVRARGEGGAWEAGALEAGLLRPAARRPPRVTLDLSGLRSLSAVAMGVLVTYCRGVVRAGGRPRLAAEMQPPVREALERAGLTELFRSWEGAEAPRALPE